MNRAPTDGLEHLAFRGRETEGGNSRSPGRDISRPYMADGVMREGLVDSVTA